MTVSDAAIAQAFREYDEGDIVQMRTILARARELDAAKPEQVHTCSYYCDRKECLKAQRDELRDRLEATPPAQAAESAQVASNPGAVLSNEVLAVAGEIERVEHRDQLTGDTLHDWAARLRAAVKP